MFVHLLFYFILWSQEVDYYYRIETLFQSWPSHVDIVKPFVAAVAKSHIRNNWLAEIQQSKDLATFKIYLCKLKLSLDSHYKLKNVSLVLNCALYFIASDKRSLQAIFGQWYVINFIARFSQNLYTFLRFLFTIMHRIWPSKVLVLSSRSVWCHGNHVNVLWFKLYLWFEFFKPV